MSLINMKYTDEEEINIEEIGDETESDKEINIEGDE